MQLPNISETGEMIVDNCLRTGQQIAVVANAIAIAISKNLTPSEENILGNLIAQVGATLLSIAAIDEVSSSSDESQTSPSANPETTKQKQSDTKPQNKNTLQNNL
jgi:hypothetical protein